MSRGPGAVEERIADLLAATRDRALNIDEITRHAYGLRAAPTRAQRLSATRAMHRLLRRVREVHDRARKLVSEAHANTEAALGRGMTGADREYWDRFHHDPAYVEGRRLYDFTDRIGCWHRTLRVEGEPGMRRLETDFWQMTTLAGRLWLHPPDVPMQVWAVTIDRTGVHWFDAEVIKVTERNVMVRYRDETARLDRRRLWRWWAFWRGVRFVASRTGRIAASLDALWQEWFGAAGATPPAMQMPLERARALLGVPDNYTKADVIAGFRRAAKKAHPDAGGTAEMFRVLVEARDRLLAAIGTSAPAPKPPNYAPRGAIIRYRSGGRLRSSSARLLR
jgi:hypothetical protein